MYWQKILSFNGYPEYGIRLSSSFDDYSESNTCLSDEENEILESYVADSWEYINKHLTEKDSSLSIHHLKQKNILIKIIDKMILSELDFYRAVRTEGRIFFAPLTDKLKNGLIKKGIIMINNHFMSFTNNPYSLKAFSGDPIQGEVENNCIIYKLGSGVKSISKISPIGEFEGIVPPGTLFEVKSVGKLNIEIKSGLMRNLWFIELERAMPLSSPHFDFYGNHV